MMNRVGFSLMRNASIMNRQAFIVAANRSYLAELGLDSNSIAKREADGIKGSEVSLWKEQVNATKDALVLKTNDEIEDYVLSITRDYFRTTKKASVTLDSMFTDHGLDSLDCIELVIRVEDELGYMIDAENLEKFKKPRHFLNFIKHMEAYKEEFNKLPTDDTKATFDFDKAFAKPEMPKM